MDGEQPRPAPRHATVLVSWPHSMYQDTFCLVFDLKGPAAFGTALKNVMVGLSLPSTLASLLWVSKSVGLSLPQLHLKLWCGRSDISPQMCLQLE